MKQNYDLLIVKFISPSSVFLGDFPGFPKFSKRKTDFFPPTKRVGSNAPPEDVQPWLRLHRGIHRSVAPQTFRDGSQAGPNGELQIRGILKS